ncbi:MAG: hypothetical protein JHC61_12915 [Burkholderiaceae bacterium]|nr:hypothetical protein [Burkholderiaceae bacterium]
MKKIISCLLIVAAAAFSPQASAQLNFRKAFCEYVCKYDPGEAGTYCACGEYPM